MGSAKFAMLFALCSAQSAWAKSDTQQITVRGSELEWSKNLDNEAVESDGRQVGTPASVVIRSSNVPSQTGWATVSVDGTPVQTVSLDGTPVPVLLPPGKQVSITGNVGQACDGPEPWTTIRLLGATLDTVAPMAVDNSPSGVLAGLRDRSWTVTADAADQQLTATAWLVGQGAKVGSDGRSLRIEQRPGRGVERVDDGLVAWGDGPFLAQLDTTLERCDAFPCLVGDGALARPSQSWTMQAQGLPSGLNVNESAISNWVIPRPGLLAKLHLVSSVGSEGRLRITLADRVLHTIDLDELDENGKLPPVHIPAWSADLAFWQFGFELISKTPCSGERVMLQPETNVTVEQQTQGIAGWVQNQTEYTFCANEQFMSQRDQLVGLWSSLPHRPVFALDCSSPTLQLADAKLDGEVVSSEALVNDAHSVRLKSGVLTTHLGDQPLKALDWRALFLDLGVQEPNGWTARGPSAVIAQPAPRRGVDLLFALGAILSSFLFAFLFWRQSGEAPTNV